MMNKTKSVKKALLVCIALLVLACLSAVFALNANSFLSAYADSRTVIEFTDADSTPAADHGALVKNADVNGDGKADVASAWKIDLKNSYGGVEFKTPIDLTGASGIQLRMYIHWSAETLGENDVLCFHKDTYTDQAWAGSIFAFWKAGAEAHRPVIQDQWVTFTLLTDNLKSGTLSKLCVVPATATGRKVYDDAYILVDKITLVKAGDTVNGENVVTEFGADQIKTDWVSNLVTDMDDNNQGSDSAFKIDPHFGTHTFALANPFNMTGVKALQFRMYMHLGNVAYGDGTTTIGMYANGTEYFVNWNNENKSRLYLQDEWFTFTVTNELSKFNGSFSSLKISFTKGSATLYDDAYILIDKITAVKDTENGENVVTEFAADQVTHKDIGWCTDVVADVDTDKDGTIDAENAFRIDPVKNTKNEITLVTPANVEGAKGLQFRVFVHWGKITGSSCNIEWYKNGNLFANWRGDNADRPIIQDQWITFTAAENFADTTFSSLELRFNSTGVEVYPDAYILIDKVVAIKDSAALDSNVITEFAADQISHNQKGWRTDIVTDMDTENHGAATAWRANAVYGSKNYTASPVTIDLKNTVTVGAGVQIRMYAHLGKITGETNIEVWLNGAEAGHWSSQGYFLFDTTRVIIQDQWITYTIAENAIASISSIGFKFPASNIEYYSDAYILVDKITKVTSSAALDSNVVTEFATDQISQSGKGWRTDLVTEMDENNQGSDSAYRIDPHYKEHTFTLAKAFDMKGVNALQFRMYMHLGDVAYGDGTTTIEMYANGNTANGKFVHWQNSSTHRTYFQDEWFTFTVTNELWRFDDSFKSLRIDFTKGSATLYDDAYILIDSITAIKDTVNGENVVTEFAADQVNHGDIGWCTDIAVNVDTDKNGTIDAATAYRMNFTALAGTFPSVKVKTIDLTGVDTFRIRVYIHWGTISPDGAALLIAAKNGPAETGLAYLSSDDGTLKQGEWLDLFVKAEDVAKLNGSITDIVVTKFSEANVTVYNDAYILFDKIYVNKYAVTFDHGEFGQNTVSVTEGTTITAPASKNEGYTVKWYADEACTTEFDFANTEIKANTTIYAKYTINVYTVTFVHGDGIANEVVENVEHGGKVEAKEGKKEGYTVKWYADEACTTEFDFTNTAITANTTIYAKYTINVYTVTYVHGDGIANEVAENVAYGTKVEAKDSKKEGYTVKWYADETCTTEFDFANTAITANTTIYAKYTIKEYTVTFVHGNGIDNEVVENVEHGAKVEAKEGKKEGHTVKWYADEACTTEFDFANTAITANTTIYAKYTANVYTVTYHDGETVIATKDVNYGENAAQNVGEKVGYSVKWYVDAACEQEYSFATPVTGNLDLYAKYTISVYTVTFVHGNGIDNEVVENVTHGGKVEAKEGKKEGYTVKWYADEACTTEFDFANTAITANTTIYAKYTANTYTVTVVCGEERVEIKVTYGGTADLSATVKEGFDVEYFTDKEMTTVYQAAPVTGDITIYAKYTEIKKVVGCGSVIGAGSGMVTLVCVGLLIAGGMILLRKKDND